MPVLIRKAHQLILYAWAIARARRADKAGIHCAAVYVIQYHLMRSRVCIGKVARPLHAAVHIVQERKRPCWAVPILYFHFVKVKRPPKHARRRAGFEPPKLKAQLPQRRRQALRAGKAARPLLPHAVAYQDAAFKIHARCNHNRAALYALAFAFHPAGEPYCAYAAVLGLYRGALALNKGKLFLRLKCALHPLVIAALVHLCARGINRGAFAGIEHAHLNKFIVRRKPHLPAKGVYLPHELAFGRAAYGGIACHKRY